MSNYLQIIHKFQKKKYRHQRKRRTECRAPSLACGSMRRLVSCACAGRRQPTWEYMLIQPYASRRAAVLGYKHRSSVPNRGQIERPTISSTPNHYLPHQKICVVYIIYMTKITKKFAPSRKFTYIYIYIYDT